MAVSAKEAKRTQRIEAWRNEVNSSTPVCAQQEACPHCEGDAAFNSPIESLETPPQRLRRAVSGVFRRKQKDGRKAEAQTAACAGLFPTHAFRQGDLPDSTREADGIDRSNKAGNGSTEMHRKDAERLDGVQDGQTSHHSSTLFGGLSTEDAKPTLAIDATAARLARAQRLLRRDRQTCDQRVTGSR